VEELVLGVMLALLVGVQAADRLPDGVPDLLDPRILVSWQPYMLGTLKDDPTRLYCDQGFAEDGRPSGQHAKSAALDSAALSALSRWAAHLQHRVSM
jgi:hypothetical protein